VALLVLIAGAASAQSPPESHATIELIADQGSTSGTGRLQAGLLFKLDPGWHIYWQNAGDSGEPPKVQWNLPPGYRALPIEWPAPKRLGSGSIIDYGYEDQVLLITPIEVPASPTQNTAKTFGLAADVKYIVCREICIPGWAHLTLSLPIGNAAQVREWHELFEQARNQIPVRAPAAWKVSAKTAKDNLILSVEGASRPQSATFFPADASVIENSAAQLLATDTNGFHLTMKVPDQGTGKPSELRGVLVLDGARAYQIAAPVSSR
jgi:DsbC/DsbD-like thiol-disulfide interchange protein